MKILVYSDLQATDGSEVCYRDPSTRLQDWRVSRFFEMLRDIHAEHGCEGLIDLGDTTDDRSSIPVPTINTLLEGLEGYSGGWNVKLIGNHEQFKRDATVHVGKLFERYFSVVDGVSVMESPDSDAVFVFAAYPGEYATLNRRLLEITQEYHGNKLVLFGHFQVIGCHLNSGLAYEGVPKEVLAPFHVGLLGHVHKPQEVARNIYYVGSPFQQNFGESGESKRVAIFDTVSLEIEWVTLTGFPVYRTVSAEEFVDEVQEDSENRYHVVLSSQADAEKLYAHPLCGRAETKYAYTSDQSSASSEKKTWTFDAILRRYMEENPPKNSGIELDLDEMVAVGTDVSKGNA